MIVEPKVTVWGYTSVSEDLLEFLPPSESDLEGLDDEGPYAVDYLAAASGKVCYTPKPNWNNEATNSTDKYIKNILSLGHYSVLAHASVTLYIEGVSRALTHELVRSRFLAFSQLSQRYCDSSDMDWVCPPLALDDLRAQHIYDSGFQRALEDYDKLTNHFMSENMGKYDGHMLRKRAREAARGVLPNITETKIVTTGNIRAWRDFLIQRLDPTADLEIMRLGHVILNVLSDYSPSSVSDLNR